MALSFLFFFLHLVRPKSTAKIALSDSLFAFRCLRSLAATVDGGGGGGGGDLFKNNKTFFLLLLLAQFTGWLMDIPPFYFI